MAFRFLGNKTKLVPVIVKHILSSLPPRQNIVIADLFCGTASVSEGLKKSGYSVIANDLLSSSVIHAQARLLAPSNPLFTKVFENIDDTNIRSRQTSLFDTPYDLILEWLNSLGGKKGFFFNEYSPSGRPYNGSEARIYFSPENAAKIDIIRETIKFWNQQNWLDPVEHSVLLHDLILAVNKVANTAGTYGHFLANISESASYSLKLMPSQYVSSDKKQQVLNMNAVDAAKIISADAFYLDPPYTKRQYAAYYHILETLAHEDEPNLIGKSGLRPWEDKSSDFCYKTRASKVMKQLLDEINAKYIFISYSGDGHIMHDEMIELLNERAGKNGKVDLLEEIKYQRYTSNRSTDNSVLKERLYKVTSN